MVLSSDARLVPLSSYAATGPLLIFVYRGSWCSFCLRRLADYRERANAFAKVGITLVALSVDTTEASTRLHRLLKLPFALLCDPSRAVVSAWGLLNTDEFGTAFPATMLLDAQLTIRFLSIDDSYATARVDDVLDVCRALVRGESRTTTLRRVFRLPGLAWWIRGARNEVTLRWHRRRGTSASNL